MAHQASRRMLLLPFAIAAIALLPAAAPQDAAGAALFRQRCMSCHAQTAGAAGTMGPNLFGVVGRKAGATDFHYSPALKAAKITWTRGNLDLYLASPGKLVPGTRMPIAIGDAAQRADLIAYLATRR